MAMPGGFELLRLYVIANVCGNLFFIKMCVPLCLRPGRLEAARGVAVR